MEISMSSYDISVLEIFDITDKLMYGFFTEYIQEPSEYSAIQRAGGKFTDLTRFRTDGKFKAVKEAVDEFLREQIKLAMFEQAEAGSFKHAEFLLNPEKNTKVETNDDAKKTVLDTIKEVIKQNES